MSKGEKDFTEGEVITFLAPKSGKLYMGIVDYSYGDEKAGHVRVQEIFSETSDEGNNFYVPVECIK